MTTLGDFGGGINEDAVRVEHTERSTPGTRCEAVIGDGVGVRRCQNSAGSREAFCHAHQDGESVKTVRSGVRTLLRLAGRRSGRCRAIKQSDGSRCEYSTSATETTCHTHEDTPPEEYADLGDGELDQREIAAAVEAVEAATGEE